MCVRTYGAATKNFAGWKEEKQEGWEGGRPVGLSEVAGGARRRGPTHHMARPRRNDARQRVRAYTTAWLAVARRRRPGAPGVRAEGRVPATTVLAGEGSTLPPRTRRSRHENSA